MKTVEILEMISKLQDEALTLGRSTQLNLLIELKQQFKLYGATAPQSASLRFSQVYSHKLIKSTLAKIGYESTTKKPNTLQGFKIRLKPKKGT